MTDRIEEAAKAMKDAEFDHGLGPQWNAAAHMDYYRASARAADPLLTADLSAEVQRLRGERDELQERIAAVSQGLADGAPAELLLRFTASAFDWNLEETQRAAKMLLTRFYPEATEAVERHRAFLASLRASHDQVIRCVREWQEANKEFAEVVAANGRPTFARCNLALAALAALDLGGAE